MSGYSNPFRYAFKEPYKSITCIYKLWFGTKYFIWKSKALHQGVNQASIELDRRLRLGYDKENMWYKVLNHIKSGRVTIMNVEVTKATNDPSELLIEEYKQLLAAKDDPKCLNMSFEPYVANWIPIDARQALEKYKASLVKKAPKKLKSQAPKKKKSKGVFNTGKNIKVTPVTKKSFNGKKAKNTHRDEPPKFATAKSKNSKAGIKRRGGRK